ATIEPDTAPKPVPNATDSPEAAEQIAAPISEAEAPAQSQSAGQVDIPVIEVPAAAETGAIQAEAITPAASGAGTSVQMASADMAAGVPADHGGRAEAGSQPVAVTAPVDKVIDLGEPAPGNTGIEPGKPAPPPVQDKPVEPADLADNPEAPDVPDDTSEIVAETPDAVPVENEDRKSTR